MNAKGAAIVAVLGALLLGFSLMSSRNQAAREKTEFERRLATISNDLHQTHQKWVEQTAVNTRLESDLTSSSSNAQTLSNRVQVLQITLTNTIEKAVAEVESVRQSAEQAAQLAAKEIEAREKRIQTLEGEKDVLHDQMNGLNNQIDKLGSQITETQRKLTASEGDREFLLKELKRLQAEKAELERQFNNLAILREQVRKLRSELSMARRLEWIRLGIYGDSLKSGERLLRDFKSPRQPLTNYNLDVELQPGAPPKIESKPDSQPPPPPPK